jgi:hypothetical protein
MLVGRSDDEELDQIDWNQVRNAVKVKSNSTLFIYRNSMDYLVVLTKSRFFYYFHKYGCPVIKAFAFACISIG